MSDRKAELAAIAGKDNVFDDTGTLEQYSSDQSFTRGAIPQAVVKPGNVEEIQKVVLWAKRTDTPLVPVSSGPPHFNGDTVPSVPGTVIVDLSGMKKIININRRNRMAIVEPGVTYSDLQPALAKQGLRLSATLMPRQGKSVITSLLEREPRMNCRYQWSSMDPLRSLEIVWGDGNRIWSGGAGNDAMDLEKQWSQEKRQIEATGPGQTDFHRLLGAAQGSLGMVTWASLKCEVLPTVQKLFLVPAGNLPDLYDFTYQLLKFRYADELFIVNNASLAYILSGDPEQVKTLRKKLPAWTAVVVIAGRAELPEERVEFQEKDIREIARGYGLELMPEIPEVKGEQLLEVIMNSSREPFWKLGYKGGCQDIFFITTLDRTAGFTGTMKEVADKSRYHVPDIGVYLQPRHQGVNCHCEFNLPYDPDNEEGKRNVREAYVRVSEALIQQGAFFTRPYGIWANLAYDRDSRSAAVLKNIKKVFDPKGIMNPGKLCFRVKEMEEV